MSARVQALFEKKIRKVTRAYEQGEEIQKIARHVGVSSPTITRWLTIEGYKHKRRGRYPVAMKSRTRELSRRGWSDQKIARLLQVPLEHVQEWKRLEENPILSGERDPLKVRGGPHKKRVKKSQSKVHQYDPNWEYVRGSWRKKRSKKKKWPPPRHKCRKHWSDDEKKYVIQLMERGLSVLAIYRRMRASKSRQMKIWRGAGKKGYPPNFPKKEAHEARKKKKKIRPLSIPDEAKAEIQALEAEALDLEKKRKALEKKIASEKEAIEKAKEEQRAISASVREQQDRAKALEAWSKKRKPIRAVKEGKKKLESPKDIRRFADNKSYFVVSNDWPELKKMGTDELEVVASVMTDAGFPSEVEASGKQPRSYLDNKWGVRRSKRWDRAKEIALETAGIYRAEKRKIKSRKSYDVPTAKFVIAASKYAKNSTKIRNQERVAAWNNLGLVGQFIARFALKIADEEGRITPQGIARLSYAKEVVKKSTPQKKAKNIRQKVEMERKRKAVESRDAVGSLASRKRRIMSPEDEGDSETENLEGVRSLASRRRALLSGEDEE